MEELKTLKDMPKFLIENKEPTEQKQGSYIQEFRDDVKFVEISDLRQEAIKHIKDAEYFIENPERDEPHYEAQLRDRINWIKHFFNITEEDLK